MVPRAGDYESVFGGLPGQVDHLPLFPKGQLARHNLLEVRYYIFVDSFVIEIAGNNAIFTFPLKGIHVLNKVAPRVASWLRGDGDITVKC